MVTAFEEKISFLVKKADYFSLGSYRRLLSKIWLSVPKIGKITFVESNVTISVSATFKDSHVFATVFVHKFIQFMDYTLLFRTTQPPFINMKKNKTVLGNSIFSRNHFFQSPKYSYVVQQLY